MVRNRKRARLATGHEACPAARGVECGRSSMTDPAADTAHVALVGCGRWGRHILRDLLALGCDVTVMARGDATARRAHDGGATRIVRSLDALDGADGVVVCTPTTTHAEVLDEVLGLGVPVYVEKPLTDDPASARRLAERASDRLFVMHKWRYHPGVRALAQIARSEELGPVAGLRTVRVGWGNPHGDVDGIWMLAPHDISIVLEILGGIPTPTHAVAERSDGLATGVIATLGDDPAAVIDVSIAHGVRRREVRLVCEGGVAVLGDAYSDQIVITRGHLQRDVTREDEPRDVGDDMPLLVELRAFVEHLRGGPPPLSSAADAAAEVATIARIRELAGVK
jgi:predicted dehydrogenase